MKALGHALASAVLAIGLGLAAMPAAADDLPLWELGVGIGALRLPHYRGASQAHYWVLPVPYVVYRGEILRADRDGARALLFDSDRLDIDLSLSASAPTRSRGNQARQGMPDLAASVELGPNLNLTLDRGNGWQLDLRLPVRAALTLESNPKPLGWLATPNLNLDLTRGPWNLGMQAGPVFGTRRYHGYFYDVTAAQVTATRAAYQAPGGLAGWQGTVALSRRFEAQWAGLFVRLDSVAGARFEDSPLVRRRSNVAWGLAWSWSLMQSERRVPEPERAP